MNSTIVIVCPILDSEMLFTKIFIKTVFPILYNIWYILLMEYLQYRNCDSKIQNYYDQVRQMTGNPQYIWTTNFDLFGESIHPEHLHGRFVQPLNRYEDVIFHPYILPNTGYMSQSVLHQHNLWILKYMQTY